MRGRPSICAAGVLLALAACSTSSDVTVDAPASAATSPGDTTAPPDSGSPSPGTSPGTSTVSWGPCEPSDSYDVEGWECGTVEVPLDYSLEGGDTITLALSRLPAADSSRRIG